MEKYQPGYKLLVRSNGRHKLFKKGRFAAAMEPSIMRYGDDKKKIRQLFTGPCYLPPEQFYQPGDCEEKGWPDVTHIVASAFEGLGSPPRPEMGWLNRFSVFTTGPPLQFV